MKLTIEITAHDSIVIDATLLGESRFYPNKELADCVQDDMSQVEEITRLLKISHAIKACLGQLNKDMFPDS